MVIVLGWRGEKSHISKHYGVYTRSLVSRSAVFSTDISNFLDMLIRLCIFRLILSFKKVMIITKRKVEMCLISHKLFSHVNMNIQSVSD